MNSQTVPAFWELYRKLPQAIRERAREAYGLFQANPAHPSLHFIVWLAIPSSGRRESLATSGRSDCYRQYHHLVLDREPRRF